MIVVLLVTAWSLSLRCVTALGLFAAGYALWTLFEYWLHRIVFHFEPEDGIGRECTGSSTASTTTTPTIHCAW